MMFKWLSNGPSGPTGGGGGGGGSGASSAGAVRLPAAISARYAREAREGEAGVRFRELLGLTERTAGRPTAERMQREAMLARQPPLQRPRRRKTRRSTLMPRAPARFGRAPLLPQRRWRTWRRRTT